MSNKKNIDRLFQEKFKDFEVAPNDAVWNRINESLPNKKKKRRVAVLWWQLGGVAAAIAILLTVGVSVFNSNGNNNQEFPVVNTDKSKPDTIKNDTNLNPSTDSNSNDFQEKIDHIKFVDSDKDQKTLAEEEKNRSSKKENASQKLINPNTYKQQSKAVVKQYNTKDKKNLAEEQSQFTTNTNKDKEAKIAANTETSQSTSNKSNASQLAVENDLKTTLKKAIEENKTVVAERRSSKTSETSNLQTVETDITALKNDVLEDSKKQSIEDAIAENTITTIEKEEDKQNRWSIAPNVAPVYYSSMGQGSSLDQQFNQNTKSSPVNISYGIAGSYAVSKKLKIRAGINRVNLNQITSDVFAFDGAETAARGIDAQFSNITFKDRGHSVSLMSSKMLNRSSAPEVFNTKIAGDIDQRFGFLEVPLELEYRLVDKKFGINVIGGFSTFFLNQNDIYAEVDGESTLIGAANNINDTSFSANFGLGVDYSLSKQWNINLEPTFKYQINTFNSTSGNFRPFFIGVYTGLSFKF